MLKELISQGNFAIWPQISLVLFFATFTAVLLWTRRRGADTHYRYMAGLTLEDAGRTAEEMDHE